MEDPLAPYDLVAFGAWDDIIDVHVFPYTHLLLTHSKPLKHIRACHSLRVGFGLWQVNVHNVGTVAIRQDVIARVVVWNRGVSGMLWAQGGGCIGSDGNGSGRSRWANIDRGSVVGFENDVLMAQSGAPFVEYDVMGFKEFASGVMHEAKSAAVLRKTEEGAGQRAC